MTSNTPKNGARQGNGAGGEINIDKKNPAASSEQGNDEPSVIARFDTGLGTELNIVIPHLTGVRIEPPDEKGDTWHELPENERPAVLVMQTVGVNTGVKMSLAQAKVSCESLRSLITDWYVYSIQAPRPTMLMTPMGEQGRVMLPGGFQPNPPRG